MSHPASSLPLPYGLMVIVFPRLKYVSGRQNKFLTNLVFRKTYLMFIVVYTYVKYEVGKKPLFSEMLDMLSVIACDPFIVNADLGN